MLTSSATLASAAVREQRLPLPVHVRWGAGVFNYSGYAALCRSVILDLNRAGVPVEVQSFDQEGAERDRFVESLAGSERWKRLLRQRVEQGVYLCCHTPAPWDGGDSFFGRRRQNPGFHAYVGLTMFESDRLPHGWAAACDSMDEIWVPSEFNRETFARGGVEPSKLHVLPVGIDTSAYDPDRIAPFEIPGRRSFCFLSVFQWTRRKGWDVLLDAYARAFTNADDVSLVIRASLPGASAAPPIREQIARHFERLGIAPSRAPHVIVLDRPMPDGSMPSLYRAADAFVLPTRGEGWGLPFMEAMASGLPTIATRWSAHLDFMHDRNSYLIDIDGLVPVERAQTIENPFYGADHKWASPSVADTARLLRHVFDNRAEAREVGRRARSEIRSRWTPARTAEWIGERVEARIRANPQRIDRMRSLERAREAQARGLTTEAMRRYQEAATVGGRWLLAAYNLASLCREVGDSRRARDLFAEIASKSGSVALRSGARFHLAWLALDEGRLDEAQPLLEACLAEAPEHQRAAALRWLVLGRAAEVAGRLDEAVGLYERAHETSPEWDRAAYNFGSALKRAGRKDQARILFSQVMRTSAVSQLRAAAHFHTAELIDETGDRQSAAGHLESCLIENPGHVRAAELLAAWTGEPAAAGAATKS